MALTVAVTGPTGEIGRSAIRALERAPEVGRIVGMARRPFDPAEHGWRKVAYRQGDIGDPVACAELCAGADVVLHLAFAVIDAGASADVNERGSCNVFRAAAAAGAARVVYASSVAAYGFGAQVPQPLTEDVEVQASATHPYAAQKARLEGVLAHELHGSPTEAWLVRPCIVAGPDATILVDVLPPVRLAAALPSVVRGLAGRVPLVRPALPDPGVPFQLVHHDDVAEALRACVIGRGEPGAYNLAGPGQVTVRDLAGALGWYTIRTPRAAVGVASAVASRVPGLPSELEWLDTLRTPVLMDCAKARDALGWVPRHGAHDTLRATVESVRARTR